MNNDSQGIFCAYGGSGSSFLFKTLKRLHKQVVERPDVAWQPPVAGRQLDEWRGFVNTKFKEATEKERLLLSDYHLDFTTDDYAVLHARSDNVFTPDLGKTVEENLAAFCTTMRAKQAAAVLTHGGIFSLFSRQNVPHVVFLIRHPVHGYASFAKPERHGDHLALLGGVDSDLAIDLWTERWNMQLDEYWRCVALDLQPTLVRFEYARHDAAHDRYLSKVFRKFDSGKRNLGVLSPQTESRIRERVMDHYCKVYNDWQLR